MTCIASRHNPRFKALRAVAAEPHRNGQAIADGIHLVSVCLERQVAIAVMVTSESGLRNREIGALLARTKGIEVVTLSDALYREITGISSPTGIAAVFGIPVATDEPLRGDAVLLEGVQDAGNVGAILRTAAAAGIRQALLGPGCAGAWSLKVLRAAQGAHFSLTIREQADLAAALGARGATSIATVARGGTELWNIDLSGPILWLLGNEGGGLSAALTEAADVRATIPLAVATESLNVAAAAAICLFEARRQRTKTREPARGGLSG
ncbi:MAG: RNA methyltransferase [Thermoflexales bacterium]|nr:RNA methyltransferase [Thermoflexales bacterium]